VVPAASDPAGRSSRSAGLRNRKCGRTTPVIHWLLVRHVPKSALRHSQHNQIIALGAESVQCSGCEIIFVKSTIYGIFSLRTAAGELLLDRSNSPIELVKLRVTFGIRYREVFICRMLQAETLNSSCPEISPNWVHPKRIGRLPHANKKMVLFMNMESAHASRSARILALEVCI
jgi:hypothetical protein